MTSSPRRGLVIGCGGTLGAAWTAGALAAVSEALDWDPRTAEVLVGTSAGAELVTMLGAGVGVDELLAAYRGDPQARPELVRHLAAHPPMLPPLPALRLGSPKLLWSGLRGRMPLLATLSAGLPVGRGDARWLSELVDEFVSPGGWVSHPAIWLVAADFDSGERVAFGSPGAPALAMREAIRASWAVPGWLPPVISGGRRYADGGILSPTSADLVAPLGLDEVVVLAPMASADPGPARGLSRIERLVRTRMTRTLDAEVALLRASGVRVLRLDPGAEDLAALGPNFMDYRRVAGVLETALRTSKAAVRHAIDSVGEQARARE